MVKTSLPPHACHWVLETGFHCPRPAHWTVEGCWFCKRHRDIIETQPFKIFDGVCFLDSAL